MKAQGWWEESNDGLLNAGVFVVNVIDENGEVVEGHPLAGSWEKPPHDLAESLGIELVEL